MYNTNLEISCMSFKMRNSWSETIKQWLKSHMMCTYVSCQFSEFLKYNSTISIKRNKSYLVNA